MLNGGTFHPSAMQEGYPSSSYTGGGFSDRPGISLLPLLPYLLSYDNRRVWTDLDNFSLQKHQTTSNSNSNKLLSKTIVFCQSAWKLVSISIDLSVHWTESSSKIVSGTSNRLNTNRQVFILGSYVCWGIHWRANKNSSLQSCSWIWETYFCVCGWYHEGFYHHGNWR